VNDYFQGAVRQLLQRVDHLLRCIKPGLPSEFHLLEQHCRQKLGNLKLQLARLIEDSHFLVPKHQDVRIRTYRRLVGELDEIETVVIPVLSRNLEEDRFLNRLVQQIRAEIRYPLLPPIISPFSQSYFYILGDHNLICVHLTEGNFLLHLPDIYHEMAHPLEWEDKYPTIEGFQIALIEFLDEVKSWLINEGHKAGSSRGPEVYKFYIENWKRSWENWGREFFCDLFATFTLGPAYAWSHFHLSATRGGNPFEVPLFTPSSHPPDDARMRAMLDALCCIGFNGEAGTIEKRWKELIQVQDVKAEPEYRRCFPKKVVDLLIEKALKAVTAMQCRVAKPDTDDTVHKALNNAWTHFWRDPAGYAREEKSLIENLKAQLKDS